MKTLTTSREGAQLRRPRASLLSTLQFLVVSAIADIIYGQNVLYSSNQNQYFLHGLARAGLGVLREDWFTQTADYTPIFSLGVLLTYRYAHEVLFYLYHALLVGLYVYGLVGIAVSTLRLGESRTRYWACLAFVLAIHSAALGLLSTNLLGVNLRQLLIDGVALQFIPGNLLQPSLFGVLLVWSIHVFLRGHLHRAVMFAALAAIVHPTHLLAAGVLVLSYMVVSFRQGADRRQVAVLGLLGVVLVLPIALYVYLAFKPTDATLFQFAGHIRRLRMADHLVPAYWLGPAAYLKILIVLGAAAVARGRPLTTILLLTLGVACGLTLVQVALMSTTLAMWTPWRLSVFLVPVSSSVLVCWAVDRIVSSSLMREAWTQRIVLAISAVIVIGSLLGGLVLMGQQFERRASEPENSMMQFVARTKVSGNVFLIPPILQTFRIRTGTPILVDGKAHPLKDTDLVEWFERYRIATRFYRDGGQTSCDFVARIARRYGVTHVVTERGPMPAACLVPVYKDDRYNIYRIAVK